MKETDIWKKQLVERIKVEMVKQHLSQSQVGKVVGVTRTNINNFLNFTNSVSVERLLQIAKAVGLNVKLVITRQRK